MEFEYLELVILKDVDIFKLFKFKNLHFQGYSISGDYNKKCSVVIINEYEYESLEIINID